MRCWSAPLCHFKVACINVYQVAFIISSHNFMLSLEERKTYHLRVFISKTLRCYPEHANYSLYSKIGQVLKIIILKNRILDEKSVEIK